LHFAISDKILESSNDYGPNLLEERRVSLALEVSNEHRIILKVIITQEFRYLSLALVEFLFGLCNVYICVFKRVHLDINVDMIEVILKGLEKGRDHLLLVKGYSVDILFGS
jgi:hypothetical protein